MVNIDTVYQKVLAIANKEQRGYITPQEFNLFADQAQLQIFEQYFYDTNQFSRVPGNQKEYSDMLDILDEKISIFKKRHTLNHIGNQQYELPENFYKLSTIYTSDGVEIQEVNSKELISIQNSYLLKPTVSRPVYYRYERNVDDKYIIEAFPKELGTTITANYIKKPATPQWNYVVITGDQAFYDGPSSKSFELHPSEEGNLVFKILSLAGISMGSDIYQLGTQEEIKEIQQQKQ